MIPVLAAPTRPRAGRQRYAPTPSTPGQDEIRTEIGRLPGHPGESPLRVGGADEPARPPADGGDRLPVHIGHARPLPWYRLKRSEAPPGASRPLAASQSRKVQTLAKVSHPARGSAALQPRARQGRLSEGRACVTTLRNASATVLVQCPGARHLAGREIRGNDKPLELPEPDPASAITLLPAGPEPWIGAPPIWPRRRQLPLSYGCGPGRFCRVPSR